MSRGAATTTAVTDAFGVSKYVALPHTEGCGSAGHEVLYGDVLVGHLLHPLVACALVLEHGCEKQHNDAMAARLAAHGVSDPRSKFGWASVQLGGGITPAVASVRRWAVEAAEKAKAQCDAARCEEDPTPRGRRRHLGEVGIAIASTRKPSARAARALCRVVQTVVAAGGRIFVARDDPLLRSALILDEVLETAPDALRAPTLRFGQSALDGDGRFACPVGLHVMGSARTTTAAAAAAAASKGGGVAGAAAEFSPTPWVETISALGASGAQLVVVLADRPVVGHPFVPTLVVSAGKRASCPDADLVLAEVVTIEEGGGELSVDATNDAVWADALLEAMRDVASRRVETNAALNGNVAFQISRGNTGVSL